MTFEFGYLKFQDLGEIDWLC